MIVDAGLARLKLILMPTLHILIMVPSTQDMIILEFTVSLSAGKPKLATSQRIDLPTTRLSTFCG